MNTSISWPGLPSLPAPGSRARGAQRRLERDDWLISLQDHLTGSRVES